MPKRATTDFHAQGLTAKPFVFVAERFTVRFGRGRADFLNLRAPFDGESLPLGKQRIAVRDRRQADDGLAGPRDGGRRDVQPQPRLDVEAAVGG